MASYPGSLYDRAQRVPLHTVAAGYGILPVAIDCVFATDVVAQVTLVVADAIGTPVVQLAVNSTPLPAGYYAQPDPEHVQAHFTLTAADIAAIAAAGACDYSVSLDLVRGGVDNGPLEVQYGPMSARTQLALPGTIVQRISIAGGPITGVPTTAGTLTATAFDSFGTPLSPQPAFTWSSSNTSAATVNGAGLVTLVGAGEATITASAQGNYGYALALTTGTGTEGQLLTWHSGAAVFSNLLNGPLQITGGLGIGLAPGLPNIGITNAPVLTYNGAIDGSVGFNNTPRFPAAGVAGPVFGSYFGFSTVAGSYTLPTVYNLGVWFPTLGAGSAIETLYMSYIADASAYGETVYAWYSEGPSPSVFEGPVQIEAATVLAGVSATDGTFTSSFTLSTGALSLRGVAYTAPASGPAISGYVLSATTSGVMSWVAQSGGGGGGQTLTLGNQLTGGSYNGSAPITVGVTPTPTFTTLGVSGLSSLASVSATSATFTGLLTVSGGISGLPALTFGAHLTGTSYNATAGVTIATDAVSTNTASTLMARDGSGNFAAAAATLTTLQTSANAGIGVAPQTNTQFSVQGTTTRGVSQFGIVASPTFGSDATTSGVALIAALRTAAASYTMVTGRALEIGSPVLGAGSGVTTNVGLDILNQTGAGIGTGYALRTGTGATSLGDTLSVSGASTLAAISGTSLTLTSLLQTAPSTTGSAGLNVGPGAAPTSPNNGDVWSTAAGAFWQIASVTKQLVFTSVITLASLALPAAQVTPGTFGAGAYAFPGELTLAASTTGAASLNIPAGTAPSAPVDGDEWRTSVAAFYQQNGATLRKTGFLAVSGTASPTTILTAEHNLSVITVPAGALAANGRIFVSATYAVPGTTATRNIVVRLSSTLGDTSGGTAIINTTAIPNTSTFPNTGRWVIQANNSTGAQWSMNESAGVNSTVHVTSAINTANVWYININGYLTAPNSSNDAIGVIGYSAEIVN